MNDSIFVKLFIIGIALVMMLMIVGAIYGLSFLGHIVVALEIILLFSAIVFVVKVVFNKIDENNHK